MSDLTVLLAEFPEESDELVKAADTGPTLGIGLCPEARHSLSKLGCIDVRDTRKYLDLESHQEMARAYASIWADFKSGISEDSELNFAVSESTRFLDLFDFDIGAVLGYLLQQVELLHQIKRREKPKRLIVSKGSWPKPNSLTISRDQRFLSCITETIGPQLGLRVELAATPPGEILDHSFLPSHPLKSSFRVFFEKAFLFRRMKSTIGTDWQKEGLSNGLGMGFYYIESRLGLSVPGSGYLRRRALRSGLPVLALWNSPAIYSPVLSRLHSRFQPVVIPGPTHSKSARWLFGYPAASSSSLLSDKEAEGCHSKSLRIAARWDQEKARKKWLAPLKYRNLDLSRLMEPYLDWIFTSASSEILKVIHVAENFIGLYRPKAFMTAYEGPADISAVISIFNREAIPTIYLSHGLCVPPPEHTDVLRPAIRVRSRHFLTPGTAMAEKFVAYGAHSPEGTVVTGLPGKAAGLSRLPVAKRRRLKRLLGLDPDLPVISCSAFAIDRSSFRPLANETNDEAQAWLSDILSAIRTDAPLSLILKYRQFTKDSELFDRIRERSPQVKALGAEIDISLILSVTDVFITLGSSTGLEAASLRIPTIIYNPFDREGYHDYLCRENDLNIVPFLKAQTIEELRQKAELMLGPNAGGTQEEEMKKMDPVFLKTSEGLAVDRIAEAVVQSIQRG